MYNKKPISDKQKLIGVWIFLLAFLALSVFFWLITKKWYCVFIPTICIYFIEYGCRIYKLREYYPPLTYRLRKLFIKKTVQEAESGIATNQSANILITSITNWFVPDMVECSFYGNYGSIGTGTPEQMQVAYNDLISQYYEVRKDEGMKDYIKLMSEMLILKNRIDNINFNVSVMRERYSHVAAAHMRKLYKQYDFTRESYLNDFSKVGNNLISLTVDYERICKQIAKLDEKRSKAATENKTPVQKHMEFLENIARLEDFKKIGIDISKWTVMYLAINENNLDKEYRRLQEQARKSK